VFSLLLAILVVAAQFPASEAAKRPADLKLPPGTPAEQVQTLIKQHEAAMTAFRKLYEAAETEEEKEKLEDLLPDPAPYTSLLMQIAEKNPKDPAAVDALIWSLRNGDRSDKAKAVLIRDHLLSPKIGPLCSRLSHEIRDDGAMITLRRVLAENPSKEAQAQAALALAKLFQERARWARNLHKDDLAASEEIFGKDFVTFLKNANAGALEKEAEDLLERIQKDKDFSETTVPRGDSKIRLGDLASRELFQMRHLQPGKLAPEIAGEDIDGTQMRLSDFRGKVILLEFWGHW
jgi:hypothetical protein